MADNFFTRLINHWFPGRLEVPTPSADEIAAQKQRRFLKHFFHILKTEGGQLKFEAAKEILGEYYEDFLSAKIPMTFETFALFDDAIGGRFTTDNGLYQVTYVKDGKTVVLCEFLEDSKALDGTCDIPPEFAAKCHLILREREKGEFWKTVIRKDDNGQFFYEDNLLSLVRIDI